MCTPHTAVPANTIVLERAFASSRSAMISASRPACSSALCRPRSASTPAGYATIAYTMLISAMTSGIQARAMPTLCARRTRNASEKRASVMIAAIPTTHQ